LVGLNIVDAFCAGLVIATTNDARHGPEIAYLRKGVNGLLTSDNAEEYAATVLKLIYDRNALKRIKAIALADSERYTLENMVSNFVSGIELALSAPKYAALKRE